MFFGLRQLLMLVLKPAKPSQLTAGIRQLANMEEPIGRCISKVEIAEVRTRVSAFDFRNQIVIFPDTFIQKKILLDDKNYFFMGDVTDLAKPKPLACVSELVFLAGVVSMIRCFWDNLLAVAATAR